MNQATFRFYSELNHFLDPSSVRRDIKYKFWGQPAIKDAIEALGVPHPEVALILINGEPVTFEAQLSDRDRVSVFPEFRRIDIGQSIGLQPAAQVESTFIADVHLGQLARYLRMLGFSCRYSRRASDAELAQQAARDDEILLTRDVELLKRSILRRGYFVRATDPQWQLVEVIGRFQLLGRIKPFRICMACNGELEAASLTEVREALPPGVGLEQAPFRRCRSCQRVYWRGSHVERMQHTIQWLRQQFA